MNTSRRGFLGGIAATLLISAGGVKLAVPQTKPLLAANGWPICNGQAIARADYADLFRCIGTVWGGDDIAFKLPDLRLRFPFPAHSLIYAICPEDSDLLPVGAIQSMFIKPSLIA